MTDEDRPMVQIVGLHKSYGAVEVVGGIDLEVMPGEVVVILGPSGAGKSTLLRCINFLERPDEGIVLVDGELIGYAPGKNVLREMTDRALRLQRAEIGMVFQRFNLFHNLTALENVMEGPRYVQRLSKEEANRRALTLLKRVGMEDKCDAYPSQLSGGQQQRVAIARALAMQPKVMLFDEPTSALDPELVGEVLAVIGELAASGMTMIIVTHEIGFARDVASRAVFMDRGVIVEAGDAAAVLNRPTNARTQSFLSSVIKGDTAIENLDSGDTQYREGTR